MWTYAVGRHCGKLCTADVRLKRRDTSLRGLTAVLIYRCCAVDCIAIVVHCITALSLSAERDRATHARVFIHCLQIVCDAEKRSLSLSTCVCSNTRCQWYMDWWVHAMLGVFCQLLELKIRQPSHLVFKAFHIHKRDATPCCQCCCCCCVFTGRQWVEGVVYLR